MDHRHTEDFARRMELAELRAQALRQEAIHAFWAALARAMRRGLHALQRAWAAERRGNALPEG